MNKKDISGLLLAGGRGSRFGGQDKGLVKIGDSTLAERQINWLASHFEECFISANRNIEYYCQLGYPVLMDPQSTFEGPLVGVLKALEQCQTDWLFVLPVVVPNLPVSLINNLIEQVEGTSKAYYLASDEREHYLNMLLSKAALSELVEYCASDEKRVRGFLKRVGGLPVNLGLKESHFANLNSISDLTKGP